MSEAVEVVPHGPSAGVDPGGRTEGGLRLTDPGRCRRGAPGRPLVSYVTVVRNARRTLERTLASVRGQQWDAVEHIVVDGLSDDGTRDIIEAHAAQIDYYVSEPDAGLYDALNKALSQVRGDLVCVLNADDWLTPDAAALAARALVRCARSEAASQPVLILTSAWLHDQRRRKLWLPAALDAGSWLRCPKICHNGVYATPAAIALAGPYDTRLRIVADTRWLCGAFDAGVRTVYCAAPTVHYVSGGLSSDLGRHVEECAQLIALRFPALDDSEVWTLMHSFYPWPDNLEPFLASRPPDLGLALEKLLSRHSGDAALRTSAVAAGLAGQLGHAGRVRRRRKLSTQLQRGLWRAWYGARDLLYR
ncbi:MAG: glycosyltransferase [Rubrivivax sp.]|nr:glycosyltransferase [Rubrivivax sp.]